MLSKCWWHCIYPHSVLYRRVITISMCEMTHLRLKWEGEQDEERRKLLLEYLLCARNVITLCLI